MREYKSKFELDTSDEDWEKWKLVDYWITSRIPDSENTYPLPYRLYFEDGSAVAKSFEEAREISENEQLRAFEITKYSKGIWLELEFRPPLQTTVSARGPNQEQVLGFTAMVESELRKGRQPPPSVSSDNVDPTNERVAPQPVVMARLDAKEDTRNWWHTPNQWVVVVVGTMIAGLAVWVITSLF